MNILVLTSEYPYKEDKNADRTKVVGYFAREWVKQGHKVIVIVNSSVFPAFYYHFGDKMKRIVSKAFDVSRTPDRLWIKRFSYTEDGVYAENLPMLKLIPHGKFSRKIVENQIDEIIAIIEKKGFKPDIVTGHWVNPQIMLVPALAKRYDAKSAFVFHADYTEKICKRFNVQRYIDEIEHIGFRSKSAIEVAKKYLTFHHTPFIAKSGIPDSFIKRYSVAPARKKSEKLKIITAARLVEYKKIDTIIAACSKSFNETDSFELTIVGDGPLKQKLKEQAFSAGISDSIHFIGQIPREELQERMRSNDVFVLVSERETFGLVYIEAMLHGCIVIASRFGGVDGIIEDGVNGFLCEEGNEIELSGIMKRIKEQNLDRIRIAAIETARHLAESDVAKSYLEVIKE